MSTTAIDRVVDLAAASLGLTHRQEWREEAARAVQVLARTRRTSPADMAAQLPDNAELLAEVSQYMTVGETFLMRYPSHFDRLAQHAEQHWQQDSARILSVWSAGSSSGEEAYSAAIAVAERLGVHRLSQLQIMGTDTNPRVVERARAATYSAWSFRGVPEGLTQRYFSPSAAAGHWRLREDVRSRVSFRCAPLEHHLREMPDQSLDVVLFRNVAIYLVPDYLDRLFAGFRRVLRPDGLLFVAPSDPRPDSRLFQRVEHDSTSVYVPQSDTVSAAVPTHRDATAGVAASRSAQPRAGRAKAVPRVAPTRMPGSRKPCVPAHTPAVRGLHTREQIEVLAQEGKIIEALAALDALNPAGEDSASQLLRGRLYLAAGESDLAVEQLRKVLYTDPGSHMTRFWYIIALRQARLTDQAQTQAQELHERLLALAPNTQIDHTPMTVAHLVTAVSQWLEVSPQ